MNALRLLSLSLLLLFGCNDSAVPLGPPETAPTIPGLTGTWEALDVEEEGAHAEMRIIRFNDHEYYLEFAHYESHESAPEIMRIRAYITPLGDRLFANVQAIDEVFENRKYMIFWFDLSEDDIIHSVMIDEDMSHITTSEELVSFVEDLVANDYLETADVMRFKKLPLDE